MTRIVLNQDQLAGTATLFDSAAGEYQGIGARILGCDCACMPADVAAVVDSSTASVRAGLDGLASELSAGAADLAQRAGIAQDGGIDLVVAGESAPNGNGAGGATLIVAPDEAASGLGGGASLTVFSDFGTPSYGAGGGGLVIGGYDQPTTGGISLIAAREPEPAGDSYLQRIAAGELPDPYGDILASLGSGIRSPVIPIGSFDGTYGMGQLDLAGMDIGGTVPPNTIGSVTHDRGIVFHPLGTFAPLW
jgi:hypothetical protein